MPDYPVGTSARVKLDRAEFHIKELQGQIRSGRHQAGGIGYRIDYETQQLVVFTQPSDVGLRWSVIAGEIIHQSRSALDHVIWDLIIANGGKPQEGLSGFPVFWEEVKYKKRVDGMIGGINEQARKIIDGLQPLGPDYKSDPLYLLNEMWNRDKHRLLNMNTREIFGLKVVFALPDRMRGIHISLSGGQLPERAEIERRDLGFDLPREVRVSGSIIGSHQFVGGPTDGGSFLETLSELHEFSKSVVDMLIATAG